MKTTIPPSTSTNQNNQIVRQTIFLSIVNPPLLARSNQTSPSHKPDGTPLSDISFRRPPSTLFRGDDLSIIAVVKWGWKYPSPFPSMPFYNPICAIAACFFASGLYYSREALLFPQNLKVPTRRDMVDMWKAQHNIFEILYSWFLAKVASKLEVFPGSEFRVAYEEACNYGGLVKFGDRPVEITLRRTWEKMPLWHKAKLLYSLVFHTFFLPSSEDLNKKLKEMDDIDMMTLENQEMSKQFPTLMETLVHERDQYMSATLLRVAGKYNSVVAVVGKGHLPGIKKYWKQPVELKRLLHVDMCSRKPVISAVKLLATVGVAVAGIYISTKKYSLE